MSSWHKLDETDAKRLAEILSTFTNKRSTYKKHLMLLHLYSKIDSRRKPCPCFSMGYRSIAKACDVSEKVARLFVEEMERNGWLVRVDADKASRYPKRTFWWMTDEDGDASTAPKKGRSGDSSAPKKGRSGEEFWAHPAPKNPASGAHNCAQNDGFLGAQVEYNVLVDSSGLVHSAIAEDGPLYSGATHDDAEEPKPKRSHREEALAWYRERGLPDPPVVPPPPGGDY